MNSPTPQDPWARLARSARAARSNEDDSAPFGLATRVVAHAAARGVASPSFVERFAFRAVALAALLALGSIGIELSQKPAARPVAEQSDAGTDDALSTLLDA